MNNKYLAMIAFSAAFLSPLSADAKSRPSDTLQNQEAAQTILTEEQKLNAVREEEENFRKKANQIVDNLLPYLENQWVEGYYGFIYKDPIYMTTGIGTKFSIGKTKMSDKEKVRAAKGDIIVNNEVMLDQIPFRHQSTGEELTYEEKVAYAKRAKTTSCGGSFDGYKRHQRLANEMDVVLTREDARKVTRAELVFKIRRIRKLIQNRYKFDIFEKPMAVQMAFTDIAFMAGEGNLMKFKNALSQAKSGNYSKLPNYTDCGKGRARNTMRRNFVRLAALEAMYNEKEMAKIKQAFDKYDLDLPLAEKIENDQTLLAQTKLANQQLAEARKTAGSTANTVNLRSVLSNISLVHTPVSNDLRQAAGVQHSTDTRLRSQSGNDFFPFEARLKSYDNVAQVYLDKFLTLGQSKMNLQRARYLKNRGKTS